MKTPFVGVIIWKRRECEEISSQLPFYSATKYGKSLKTITDVDESRGDRLLEINLRSKSSDDFSRSLKHRQADVLWLFWIKFVESGRRFPRLSSSFVRRREGKSPCCRKDKPKREKRRRKFRRNRSTNFQLSIGRNSDSVTGGAEMFAHRGDETDFALVGRIGDAIPFRRVVSIVLRKFLQRKIFSNRLQHFFVRIKLLLAPLVLAERHVFDESHRQIRLIARQLDEITQFIRVDSIHHHAIDFHQWIQFGHVQRQANVRNDASKRRTTGDEIEFLFDQRIQRDVQRIETGSSQRFEHSVK